LTPERTLAAIDSLAGWPTICRRAASGAAPPCRNKRVAKSDPDAQDDPPAVLCTLVGDRHGLLKGHGAAYRLDSAGELDQDAVSHDLDDSAVVLRHHRLEDFRAAGLEDGQGAGLVGLHHSAVADHVRG
jgi:hypothetical protein